MHDPEPDDPRFELRCAEEEAQARYYITPDSILDRFERLFKVVIRPNRFQENSRLRYHQNTTNFT